MFQVMLVDDDAYARANLKSLFNGAPLEYLICGEASNGVQALQMIGKCHPDIIITDISMPLLDGIGLIEAVARQNPEIQLIALSGYDDFDYVRQSMKLGVVDYLLKHRLTEKELSAVLGAAGERIRAAGLEMARQQQFAAELNLGKETLKQKFLCELVLGATMAPAVAAARFAALGIQLKPDNLAVMIVDIDDFSRWKTKYTPKEWDAFIQSFLDLVKEILKDFATALIFHCNEERFVLLFSFANSRSGLYFHTQLTHCAERIRNTIKRYFNITVSCGVSQVRSGFDSLAISYLETDGYLKNKFFEGKDHIFLGDEPETEGHPSFSIDIALEKKIVADLKSGDSEKTIENIEQIFRRIFETKINHQTARMIGIELINIARRVGREMGADRDSDESVSDSAAVSPYLVLAKLETLADMKQEIRDYYQKLLWQLQNMNLNNNYTEYTRKAIQYMRRHFDRDLSLDDTAAAVGVSSSYLSRVFKEDCGKGFVEYLNMIRVERAKILIQSQRGSLKEIVQKAGFRHYNYFFKVFKDLTGMTPLDYERHCNEPVNKKLV